MGADIILLNPGAKPHDAPGGLLELAGLEPATPETEARYRAVLPLAQDFVREWIHEPDALADFIAWAHARGGLKF